MTPEITMLFEVLKWAVILLLGYFILPMKKKIDEHCVKIAKIEVHYQNIKESLDKIEKELKKMNNNNRGR